MNYAQTQIVSLSKTELKGLCEDIRKRRDGEILEPGNSPLRRLALIYWEVDIRKALSLSASYEAVERMIYERIAYLFFYEE